jgi:hypothetical protein
MRLPSIVISTVATGYLAYVANDEIKPASKVPAPAAAAPVVAYAPPATAEPAPAEPAPAAPETSAPEGAPTAAETPALVAVAPTPAPEPPKIRTAPPGSFFLTRRVSVENSSGIIAILPGEMVKLLYRNKDGTVRVKWGAETLTVPEAQLAREFDATASQPISAQGALASAKVMGQRTGSQSGSRRE